MEVLYRVLGYIVYPYGKMISFFALSLLNASCFGADVFLNPGFPREPWFQNSLVELKLALTNSVAHIPQPTPAPESPPSEST